MSSALAAALPDCSGPKDLGGSKAGSWDEKSSLLDLLKKCISDAWTASV
jgi:hypothetical protein